MPLRKIRAAFVLLLVFVFSLIVHESGHYVTARLFGVKVERFALGWGPSLVSTRIGDTEFAIAAVPIGAQVQLFSDTLNLTADQEFALQAGLVSPSTIEEARQKDPEVAYEVENFKHSFIRQEPFDQSLIICAGPLSNVIFALVLTFVAVLMPHSAEEEAGNRARQRPFMSDEPDEALIDAIILPLHFFGRKVKGLELTGPLGIIAEGMRMCAISWRSVLVYASSLNIALAYFNLLPLCPLDGGRLSLLAIDTLIVQLSPVLRHNIEAIECWLSLGLLGVLVLLDLNGRNR